MYEGYFSNYWNPQDQMFAHVHQQVYKIRSVTSTCLDRRSNRLTKWRSNYIAFSIQVHSSPITFHILHPKLDAYLDILLLYKDSCYFCKITLSKNIQPVLSLSFMHEQKLWINSALYNVMCPFTPVLTHMKSSSFAVITFPPNLNYRSWYTLYNCFTQKFFHFFFQKCIFVLINNF